MALSSKRKDALEMDALALGEAYFTHRYHNVLYIPQDYVLGWTGSLPAPGRRTWQPYVGEDLRDLCAALFDTLFVNDKQFVDFTYMVEQCAKRVTTEPKSLLIKTDDGLMELGDDGILKEPEDTFIPNTLPVPLNTDQADQLEMFAILTAWLGGNEEDAHSLLHHLATALAPHWSAVKYVLFLGAGRNGKSVLLSMLQTIFGKANCSNVSRQEMAESKTTVTALNGKLLNLVFDGMAEYVKDSGNEKSLTAGEPVSIRRLYRSDATVVQTNALFVEALNTEPKSSDKSTALQARLVRFSFPNQYEEDTEFFNRMTSERYCGALLALLVEHYVPMADRQALIGQATKSQLELRFDHMMSNNPVAEFIGWFIEKDMLGATGLIGKTTDELYQEFQAHRILSGDTFAWDKVRLSKMFVEFLTYSAVRQKRVNGLRTNVRTVTGFTTRGLDLITYLTGVEYSDDDTAALVAD